jgi:2,3-dihydroxybenzoate-AMP ligase/mycobactin salicyl-AMP ligase
MVTLLEGVTPFLEIDAQRYNKLRWWPGLTLGDLLDRASDIHPDKEAFVDRRSRITYRQARDKTDQLALGMLKLGIKPLERVLLQLPNWNEFVYSYFALQKIGAIPVLLIERYRQFEISRLIELTGATAWIVASKYKKTDYLPIIRDIQKEHQGFQKIITVRGEKNASSYTRIEELIPQTKPTADDRKRLAKLRPDPLQVAHMGPTGGTTGKPKIVPRTHNSLVTGTGFCSKSWNQHTEDINLIAGPIGHDLSFSKAFLGSVLTLGKTIFLDTTTNEDICTTIEAEKVTSIIWVPALAQRLVDFKGLDRYDLSSLKKMHSAGAASHPDLVKKVTKVLGMKFYNGYGATEGMTTITRANDDLETICSTVGRPTCPYDTYQVIDFDENPLPPDSPGELVIKGPGVFTGYYNNPEENQAAFTKDGFFKTGDVAVIDEKGYIRITGRIKEMINRGGECISCIEIEELIYKHPQVSAVAVVPMPDSDLGERACAYIQPQKGAKLTFDEIIAFLKSKKASVLQLPERIEFIDQMPHTAAQKLDKKALMEDIKKKIETI